MGDGASDGITSAGGVAVSGLEEGATWEFSTDGGTTWAAGTGTSIALAAGTYAAGTVQVRQTDAAGNLGTAASLGAVTVDTSAATGEHQALPDAVTDGMLDQIKGQLVEREQTSGASVNKTEVVMLEAQLLGIEDLGDGYMASVEFSGMIREEPSAGPSPFREVWNMTKPKSGSSGWLVAGVQALQ